MSMIEKVARAIHAAIARGEWETVAPDERERYFLAARRIVSAMRMPTAGMLAEGARRDLPGDAANVWERMIFRALGD